MNTTSFLRRWFATRDGTTPRARTLPGLAPRGVRRPRLGLNVEALEARDLLSGGPVAVDDPGHATVVNQTVVINVLANDYDPRGWGVLIDSVGTPGHGTAVADPGNAAAVDYTPEPGFTGADSFTYTIRSNSGSASGTSSAVVTVTVSASQMSSAGPRAVDDVASTTANTPVTIPVLSNDSDADGNPLTVQGVTAPAHGTAAPVGNAVAYTPAADYTGTDAFGYTVSDGQGGTSAAVVTVTINPASTSGSSNANPPVAVDDAASTPEGTAVSVPVLGNDTDPTSNPPTVSIVTPPQQGMAWVNANEQVVYQPAPGFVGTDTLSYQFNDGVRDSNVALVSFEVEADGPPTFNQGAYAFNLPENSAVGTNVGAVAATDPAGQALTYAITAGNGAGAFTINAATGQITVANGAPLDFEATPNFFDLTVQASNGQQTATVGGRVQLSNVNEPPYFVPASGYDFSVTENAPAGTLVGTAVANDPDVTSAQFGPQSLRFAISDGNVGGAFAIDPATGDIRVANAAAVDYEVNPFFVLTLTVTDGGGLSASTVAVITVNDVDEPPVFDQGAYAFDLQYRATAGMEVGKVRAVDPEGQAVTYSIQTIDGVAPGPNAQFTVAPADNGRASISLGRDLPTYPDPMYTVVVRAADPAGHFTDVTVTITPRTMVVVTGDTHAVEASGDPIQLHLDRIGPPMALPLTVTVQITWDTAVRYDLTQPQDLDGLPAGAPTPASMRRTFTIPANCNVLVLPQLFAADDPFRPALATFFVSVVPGMPAPNDYMVPGPDALVDLTGIDTGFVGKVRVDCQITDGIALYGRFDPTNPARAVDPNDVDVNDIKQGSADDCFFLAAIGALAQKFPNWVEGTALVDNGDGTATARFYWAAGVAPDLVRVPIALSWGVAQAKWTGDVDGAGNYEVWPAIWENAYRQWKGVGALTGPGRVSDVWLDLTGQAATRRVVDGSSGGAASSAANLAAMLQSAAANNQMVCIGTKPTSTVPDWTIIAQKQSAAGNLEDAAITLVPEHAYIVTAVVNNGVWLYNPWGTDGEFKLTWDQFQTFCRYVYTK